MNNRMISLTIPPAETPFIFTSINQGELEVIQIPVTVTVDAEYFLHIGTSNSPLTEKKGAVFKVNDKPVIPASSFKGALRNQIEYLLMTEQESFATLFNLPKDKQALLKPCIPSSKPSKAESELMNNGQYRATYCQIQVKEERINMPYGGLCPVCYFMGAAGIMGFLRISNLFPKENKNNLTVDKMGIRTDRKLQTAADKAAVKSDLVKPDMQFLGTIDMVISSPIGLNFGYPRKVAGKTIDCWLEHWQENNQETRRKVLLERLLIPALQNICWLGGQKSAGSGKVIVSIGDEGK